MQLFPDGTALRTKIVATLGPERDGFYGPDGSIVNDRVTYDVLLPWFIHSGVDIFRLNMAFADRPSLEKVCQWLDEHRSGLARNVALLGDLPGPKIRISPSEEQLHAEKGMELPLLFDQTFPEEENSIAVLAYGKPFSEIVESVSGFRSIGDYVRNVDDIFVYIGDGEIVLRALPDRARAHRVLCRVERGGTIEASKGLAIQGCRLELPTFQEPDKRALELLLDIGRDFTAFIGASFVRGREDVLRIKKHIEDRLVSNRGLARREAHIMAPAVIAKIETIDAWKNIDDILDVADGVMVARGDLALHLHPEEVPAIQKKLIEKCNMRGKAVITATQMLGSMMEHARPTRAEATDVFNAILDGTDAVMLSGETSTGMNPIESIRMMVRIAGAAEAHFFELRKPDPFRSFLSEAHSVVKENTERLGKYTLEAYSAASDPSLEPEDRSTHEWSASLYAAKLVKSRKQSTTDRISRAACDLSEGSETKAIIAPTTTGRTARMICRFRPAVPVIGAAHDPVNARKLLISFGVYPICIGEGQESVQDVLETCLDEALKPGYIAWEPEFVLIESGDTIVSTSGTPLFEPGTTNLIQIREVLEPEVTPGRVECNES